VKHYLWHGNIEAALERLEPLLCDLDLIRRRSNSVAKLCRSATECDTYIRNKMDAQRSTSPLHTWTRVLNDNLDAVFRAWHPKFRPVPTSPPGF
jgi:hypothetical protein